MGVDAVMFARVPRTDIDSRCLTEASYLLASTIGWKSFFIDGEEHALAVELNSEEFDYPQLPTREGTTLIRVNLSGRYYGPGYERGPWLEIKATAEWLERYFGGADVFYGGDCDDVLFPFGPAERQAIHDHFLDNGHRPYKHGGQLFPVTGGGPVCHTCKTGMFNGGGGGGLSFWLCDGCGRRVVVSSAGSHPVRPNEDFFSAVRRIRGLGE